jgi:hypothetical protein
VLPCTSPVFVVATFFQRTTGDDPAVPDSRKAPLASLATSVGSKICSACLNSSFDNGRELPRRHARCDDDKCQRRRGARRVMVDAPSRMSWICEKIGAE